MNLFKTALLTLFVAVAGWATLGLVSGDKAEAHDGFQHCFSNINMSDGSVNPYPCAFLLPNVPENPELCYLQTSSGIVETDCAAIRQEAGVVTEGPSDDLPHCFARDTEGNIVIGRNNGVCSATDQTFIINSIGSYDPNLCYLITFGSAEEQNCGSLRQQADDVANRPERCFEGNGAEIPCPDPIINAYTGQPANLGAHECWISNGEGQFVGAKCIVAQAGADPSLRPDSVIRCVPTGGLFGIPVWYEHLTCDSDGNPTISTINDIWLIGAAILEIMLYLASGVAVGYIIFGGFKYITSQGSPDGIKDARDTIINAVVGLVIAILAANIVSFIASQF